jgi:hypothetical protein
MIKQILKYEVFEKEGILPIEDLVTEIHYNCIYYGVGFNLDEQIDTISKSYKYHQEEQILIIIKFVPQQDSYSPDEWEIYKDYFINPYFFKVITT